MLPDYRRNPPKNLFFTGKGGVGKTTTAAATAIALAERLGISRKNLWEKLAGNGESVT